MLFEFPKQRFAAIAGSASPSVVGRLCKGTNGLTGGLFAMHKESSVAPSGTRAFWRQARVGSPNAGYDIWASPSGGEPIAGVATPFNEMSPSFSPDGQWLAYVSNESGRNDVYVQTYPGGGKQTVSTDGGLSPVWSPGGDELFYRVENQVMAVSVQGESEPRIGAPRPVFEARFTQNPFVGEVQIMMCQRTASVLKVLPESRNQVGL